MVKDIFWSVIKDFNKLMSVAIEGPNCIDPNICKGDCCSIKIDVPKLLAKRYIKMGFALKNDFIRGDVFSFHLRFDEKMGKCFLFDKKINGCSVHDSGIKPPQCWIYPTNFSIPKNVNEVNCKRAKGWKIIYPEKTKKAEELLKKYVFFCQIEAKKELKNINKRIGRNSSNKSMEKVRDLRKRIQDTAPYQLGGFIDAWNELKILSAEGISLQMKKFCQEFNAKCSYILNDNFLECSSICEKIADELIKVIQENLYHFIKTNDPDTDGQYPLYKLFQFVSNE